MCPLDKFVPFLLSELGFLGCEDDRIRDGVSCINRNSNPKRRYKKIPGGATSL
jgi:hypothetical protein